MFTEEEVITELIKKHGQPPNNIILSAVKAVLHDVIQLNPDVLRLSFEDIEEILILYGNSMVAKLKEVEQTSYIT